MSKPGGVWEGASGVCEGEEMVRDGEEMVCVKGENMVCERRIYGAREAYGK